MKKYLTHYRPSESRAACHAFQCNAQPRHGNVAGQCQRNLGQRRELANTLAFDLEGSQRSLALAIHQLVELGGLLVERALEHVAPFEPRHTFAE